MISGTFIGYIRLDSVLKEIRKTSLTYEMEMFTKTFKFALN